MFNLDPEVHAQLDLRLLALYQSAKENSNPFGVLKHEAGTILNSLTAPPPKHDRNATGKEWCLADLEDARHQKQYLLRNDWRVDWDSHENLYENWILEFKPGTSVYTKQSEALMDVLKGMARLCFETHWHLHDTNRATLTTALYMYLGFRGMISPSDISGSSTASKPASIAAAEFPHHDEIADAVKLSLQERFDLSKTWPGRAEAVVHGPCSDGEWNDVGRECGILGTLVSEAGFDATTFEEFVAAMPPAREWYPKLKGLSNEDCQKLGSLLNRAKTELRKLTAKLKGELARQLAEQDHPILLQDDGSFRLGGVPDELHEEVSELVNQQFNSSLREKLNSVEHWHTLSRERIKSDDRCRMTLAEASQWIGMNVDGLLSLIRERLVHAFPDTGEVWTFSRSDLEVRRQLQKLPVATSAEALTPRDAIPDERMNSLLKFLQSADDAAGIPLMELPDELLDEVVLTHCEAEKLIEFGRRNHVYVGGGVHATLKLENGYEFGSMNKTGLMPVPQFVRESLADQGPAELRTRVRLTYSGHAMAAKMLLQAASRGQMLGRPEIRSQIKSPADSISSLAPGYPRPDSSRLTAAETGLNRVEQFIAPGSTALVSMLVRAMLSDGFTTAEAMWAIYCRITSGQYLARLFEALPADVRYIVSEGNPPAGLKLADGAVHIDGGAGDWGMLTVTFPGQSERTTPLEEDVAHPKRGEQVQNEQSVEDSNQYIFHRDSETYLVSGFGEQGRLPASGNKGLEQIRLLLQKPGQGVPMVILNAVGRISAKQGGLKAIHGLVDAMGVENVADLQTDRGSRQPVWSAEAKAKVWEKIEGLQDEQRLAESHGNKDESEQLQRKIDELIEHSKAATGLNGKDRDLNDLNDRLRPNINAALKRIYKKLREANPPMPKLADHLDISISAETDSFVYKPGGLPIRWITEPKQ